MAISYQQLWGGYNGVTNLYCAIAVPYTMDEKTYGALKRIIEEVKEKRKAKCLFIDCIINHRIGGNDIDLVEGWIGEVAKKYEYDCEGCGATRQSWKGLCDSCKGNTKINT